MVLVSSFLGDLALQPVSAKTIRKNVRAGLRTSVHHVKGKDNGTVCLAAEDKTVADEVAGLLWRELDLRRAMLVDFERDIQFANAKAVRYILALQDEKDWLAFLKCDIAWGERELARSNFDAAG